MYNTTGVLMSIQLLLNDPNPDSPANTMASKLFRENIQEYNKQVQSCVENSWVYSQD